MLARAVQSTGAWSDLSNQVGGDARTREEAESAKRGLISRPVYRGVDCEVTDFTNWRQVKG
jgi:hypothetical protein